MPSKQGDAPQSVSPCSMFRISGGSYKNLSILLYLNLPSGDELFGSIMRVCSRRHLSGNSTKFQEVGGNYDHLFGEVIPDGKTDERTTGGKKGKSYRIIKGFIRHMFKPPSANGLQYRHKRVPCFRKAVFNLWRNTRIFVTDDEMIRF